MSLKEKKIRKASEAFFTGINCSQCTALPFAEEMGMDEKTILNAMVAFGGGVARLREVCGVASGIAFVVGVYENFDFSDPGDKNKAYDIAQQLILKFADKYGTYNCGELLEYLDKTPELLENKEPKYKERSCAVLVEDGVAILCDYMGID